MQSCYEDVDHRHILFICTQRKLSAVCIISETFSFSIFFSPEVVPYQKHATDNELKAHFGLRGLIRSEK